MINIYKSNKAREQVINSYNQLLKLWNTDLKEIDLKTKYGSTHCIISGDKVNPPLLMFHGVGDNSAVMWIKNIKELSKHFYCIAVDTIGGPGKSIPNENFTKKKFNQVDWINNIIEQLKISKINIVGVSNGAYMAYNYTTQSKDKINKVVCLEGGMLVESPLKTMIKTLSRLFPQILFPTHKNLISIMKKLTSPDSNFFENCPAVVDHLVLLMKNHNRKAMFIHKLEEYNREKAIVVKDKIIFLIGNYKIEDKNKFIHVLDESKFRYKVIEGAGHAINHEQPKRINNEIKKFIL